MSSRKLFVLRSSLILTALLAAGIASAAGPRGLARSQAEKAAAISPSAKTVALAASKLKPAAPAEAPVLPAMSAEQLVEKNVAARGGLDAWKRVQTMAMEGVLDAGRRREDGGQVGKMTSAKLPGERRAELRQVAFEKKPADDIIQLPYQMEFKRPYKVRVEVPFQGDKAVQVYDGEKGWKLRPYLGRRDVEAFTPEETRAAAQQQQLDGYLIDYAAKGTRIESDGTELVEGNPAYRLKLTLKDGEQRRVWIDAQSFLELKAEVAPRRMDGKMRTVSTYFRDYKSVQGLLIPHLVETSVEGMRNTERLFVERVALNPPLEDARFAQPQ